MRSHNRRPKTLGWASFPYPAYTGGCTTVGPLASAASTPLASAAPVMSGRSGHGPGVAQTDYSAIGDYTYFLDDVNQLTNL